MEFIIKIMSQNRQTVVVVISVSVWEASNLLF